MSTPHKATPRSSVPPPVGDGKKSKTSKRISFAGPDGRPHMPFHVMASLCEEDELRTQLPPPGESEEALAPVCVVACTAAAPAKPACIDVFAALCKKEGCWGDLAVFGDLVAALARKGYVQRTDGTWRDLSVQSTLKDLFAQPFATRLGTEDYDDEVISYLNTEELTQEEFESLMRWLYFEGWHVPDGEELWCAGQTVEIWSDTLKARSWVPYTEPEEVVTGPSAFQLAVEAAACRGPSRFMLAAAAAAGAGAEAEAPAASGGAKPPKPAAAPKPRVVIPRFCRAASACPDKDTTCNYVHGDTIPCQNKPCGFDKPAEGKCCSGEKRKTCIFMHASEGQTWSPEQVIHRPPPA